MSVPDKPGFWYLVPENRVIEIYALEPVGGQLCFWGPDIGYTYSGSADTQGIWTTDEWQGHIIASVFSEDGWVFLSEEEPIM